MRPCLLGWCLGLAAAAAAAEPVVVSPAPDRVSVTVYRDQQRQLDEFIDLEDPLNGFALITETRTVELPPGEVTVRFEGVASGIQPETAIVVGADPAEKNQDRLLLSERGLVDAYTGQRVIVRRTDRATGKVTEESARIRSSHGGIILETAAGFESLYCTGRPQTLIYPRVPPGLSAKPVLSVRTRAQAGGRQQLTLSYLAGDFDWQANYVARLSPDTESLELFAWLTLASRDDTSFPDADTAAVAGRLARKPPQEDEDEEDEEDRGRYFHYCWPNDTTGQPPFWRSPFLPGSLPEIEAPIAIRDAEYYGGGGEGEDIMVTGTRIARLEPLGDLKLYRIPFPVTVAPRSQKQVAFLSAPRVKGELIYRTRLHGWTSDVEWLFRFRNEKREGLGQPLPRGQVAMFQQAFGRPMLLGETKIDDKAVGEDVELVFEEPPGVEADEETVEEGEGWTRTRLVVTNSNPFPILFEAEFTDTSDTRYERFSGRTTSRFGSKVWRVRIPAESSARIAYREVDVEEEEDEEEGEDD